MIQNILALIIVFAAAIISVYSVIRSITSKKASGCNGCSSCEIKYVPGIKRHNRISKEVFQNVKFLGYN